MDEPQKKWYRKNKKKQNLNEIISKGKLKKVYIPNKSERWYKVAEGELPKSDEIVLGKALVENKSYYGFFKRISTSRLGWEWGICDNNHVVCNGLDDFDTNYEHNVVEWMFIGKDG